MRTRLAAFSLALLTLAQAAPSGAAGIASDNVEYITTIPIEVGTWTTARLYGDYLYVSGNKSFTIFDVSTPESPALVSHTPTGVQLLNEDIDTNGDILLLSDERGRGLLHIWDVSDKAAPKKLAELSGMIDHTFACVLDCTWAYGAGGDIIDLRDPAKPVLGGRWIEDQGPMWGFDTTEVSPRDRPDRLAGDAPVGRAQGSRTSEGCGQGRQ